MFRKKRKKRHMRIRRALKKLSGLDWILICVFVYMVIFNQQMIIVYMVKGSAPESAWCALVAALIGECGICGWIKTTKEKQRAEGLAEKESREERTGAPEALPPDPEEIKIAEAEEEDNEP